MEKEQPMKPFVFYSDKLSYKAVNGPKGREYYVEGHISTGDLDLVNDIVTKNCMESMDSQFNDRIIKLDLDHETLIGKTLLESESNKTKLPLGKAISHEVDSKGPKVSWKLNPTYKKFDEKGNVTLSFEDVWQNIEEGNYDAFSIAYIPTRTSLIQRDGKTIRLLDDVNLLNVALTGNAINPNATMTAVMAKSLAFMKAIEGSDEDMKKLEIKSIQKKSYKEDGKHVHTAEKPMGEHNHPEIESALNDIWDSIFRLHERISDISHPAESETGLVGKSKTGKQKMADEQTEQKADAQAPEGTEQPAQTSTPETPAQETAVEEGSKESAEGKSTLESVTASLKSLAAEVKSLKDENAKLRNIVEKPQQKSRGAENNANKPADSEVKSSVGPLDMVL